jgi:hypothetical protein
MILLIQIQTLYPCFMPSLQAKQGFFISSLHLFRSLQTKKPINTTHTEYLLNLNAYCGVYRLAGFKAGLPLAFLLYTI